MASKHLFLGCTKRLLNTWLGDRRSGRYADFFKRAGKQFRGLWFAGYGEVQNVKMYNSKSSLGKLEIDGETLDNTSLSDSYQSGSVVRSHMVSRGSVCVCVYFRIWLSVRANGLVFGYLI